MSPLAFYLILFYVALRMFGTGLDLAEPETILLSLVAFFAWVTAMITAAFYERKFILPPPSFAILGGLFMATAGLAIYTAQNGNPQAAADLAWNWLADAQIFWAVLILARHAEKRRLIIAMLLAGLALTAVFGIYQYFYALDYLRTVLSSDGAAALAQLGSGIEERLNSPRITGQFAYANATAGLIIMLLPLCIPLGHRARTLAICLGGGALMALIFTGSKAGIASGVLIFMLMLARQRYYIIGLPLLAVAAYFLTFGLPVDFTAALQKHFSVRYYYWLSAWEMFSARPFTGFGLDNFATFYAQFSHANATDVTRVHNLYLQLAVDGGVIMLAAFIGMWSAFFKSPLPTLTAINAPLTGETPASASAAIKILLAAFAVTYLFFYAQIFSSGWGIEFFSSALARGETVAAIIHGAVNLLGLPLSGAAVLYYLLKSRIDPARFNVYLRYGIFAALLHFFFDFHYYHSAISGIFWVVTGLALPAREIALPARTAKIIAGVLAAATAVFLYFWYPQWQGNTARVVAEKFALSITRANAATAKPFVLEQINEALKYRPHDKTLWRLRQEVEATTAP